MRWAHADAPWTVRAGAVVVVLTWFVFAEEGKGASLLALLLAFGLARMSWLAYAFHATLTLILALSWGVMWASGSLAGGLDGAEAASLTAWLVAAALLYSPMSLRAVLANRPASSRGVVL